MQRCELRLPRMRERRSAASDEREHVRVQKLRLRLGSDRWCRQSPSAGSRVEGIETVDAHHDRFSAHKRFHAVLTATRVGHDEYESAHAAPLFDASGQKLADHPSTVRMDGHVRSELQHLLRFAQNLGVVVGGVCRRRMARGVSFSSPRGGERRKKKGTLRRGRRWTGPALSSTRSRGRLT